MSVNHWLNELRGLLAVRRARRSVIVRATIRRPSKRRVRPGIEALEERIVLASDFGDALQPYPTMLTENGAQHESIGPMLGNERDSEGDGAHSVSADADDMTGSPDDEEGVTFPASIAAGQLGAQITVNVAGAPSGAKLDGWIDFDGDGNWGGPQEQIASSVAVVNGDNVIQFDVPSGAPDGTTYARFRLSTAGNLAVRGAAADGEVEDHTLTLLPPAAASGVFSSQQRISTSANGAFSVYAADVDGDGDLDVLSASYFDDKIAWYENNGSQNFTAHDVNMPDPDSNPFNATNGNADGALTVYAADVDGDGDLDVLSASYWDDKIAWYENDGSQNFTPHTISTEADFAAQVYAADVDGDGDLDVLSSSYGDDKIAWYENDGSQNFTPHIISTAADVAISVYAADVDGDLDVLSASAYDDKIAWYENDGSQNFTPHIISTAADFANWVYAADVDGDGDTDVLSASDDKIAWYENDGNQTFTPHIISTTANEANAVYAADVDGDGDLDVLGASYVGDKIAWYENDGSQVFTRRTISTAVNRATDVYAADVDGDGDLDVLSASKSDDTIAWYENLGVPDGDYNSDGDYNCDDINALTTAVATGGSVAVFDLNGDAVLSLADVNLWLALAGDVNLGGGRVYRPGDANLNGAVDGSDFGIWNAHKFSMTANWCDGDFNASGAVDGSDFGIWNANKFTSSDATRAGGHKLAVAGGRVAMAPPASLVVTAVDNASALSSVVAIPSPAIAADPLGGIRSVRRTGFDFDHLVRASTNRKEKAADAVFAQF